jgi:hypothetical protein
MEAGRYPDPTLETHRVACTEAYLSPQCRAHLAWRSSCKRGRCPQPQDVGEQLSRHRDLGHLERNVAVRAHHLRADLDQLLTQAGQRPWLRRLGCRQRPHEIAQVVGRAWSWRRTALAEKVLRETRGKSPRRPANAGLTRCSQISAMQRFDALDRRQRA